MLLSHFNNINQAEMGGWIPGYCPISTYQERRIFDFYYSLWHYVFKNDDIGAFESKKDKTKFYDAEFEL